MGNYVTFKNYTKKTLNHFIHFMSSHFSLTVKIYVALGMVTLDSIECIRDPCLVSSVLTYTVLIVWLKIPQSQLSKTFCGLKIG